MEYRVSARFRIDAAGRLLRDDAQSSDNAQPSIEEAGRYFRARDYPAATHKCDAILALRPRDFDALHLRGVLFLAAEQPAEALDHLRRAEQERPDVAQLQFNIGNALLALKRHQEAVDAFRRALTLQPDNLDVLNNLGNALSGNSRYEEAVACLRQALALRPNSPQPLFNLARALLALDQLEEAADCIDAARAAAGPDIEPSRLIDLYTCLSDVRVRQCRYKEALAICRGVPPEIADAPAVHWNESLTQLILGDYAEGWRKYECRFQVPDHDPPREGAAVLNLCAVPGRRVLVFHEQGRGDMLQFARYLPLLAARGATVLVETYADLVPLFRAIDGVTQVVAETDLTPQHELLTPLLSLPLAFGTTLGTVPAAVPYLRVPASRLERWAAVFADRSPPRVGIAWCGSRQSARRSAMPLAMLAPLLAVPGVDFHVLQKDIAAEERTLLATHAAAVCHDAMLEDFADTAALIAHMDLVISIDTAVAHLAGGLGKPVWVMLPFSPDWRWVQNREDSPWYPTARLFRQTGRRDWHGVVRRVTNALSLRMA